MNRLPVTRSVLYTQRVLGAPGANIASGNLFDVQKKDFGDKSTLFFDTVSPEIGLGNVGTWQV